MTKKSLILGLMAFGLFGCKKIQIKNGQIPQEYVDEVQPYVGDYTGSFHGQQGELTLSLQGNVLTAHFSGAKGNDLLSPECDSQIGPLLEATINDDGTVGQVVFAFNPNRCVDVVGERLYINVENQDGKIDLNASMLDHYEEQSDDCHFERDSYECHPRPDEPIYDSGEFQKAE